MVNAIGRTTVPRLNKPIANLSLLAKIVNDDTGNLDDRRAWAFFASKLAPTVTVPKLCMPGRSASGCAR